MGPSGLMLHQEGCWSLPGSGAAEQLGNWVCPSRTAGLDRALGLGWLLAAKSLEEVGVMTQKCLLLGAQPLDR